MEADIRGKPNRACKGAWRLGLRGVRLRVRQEKIPRNNLRQKIRGSATINRREERKQRRKQVHSQVGLGSHTRPAGTPFAHKSIQVREDYRRRSPRQQEPSWQKPHGLHDNRQHTGYTHALREGATQHIRLKHGELCSLTRFRSGV